jgi:SRSO17 transposase
MSQAGPQAGTRRCRWVACAEALGRAPPRLDPIARLGWWYDAEVPPATQVWRERPATMGPAGSGRGRQPSREQVVAGAPKAQPVARLAAALPVSRWSRPTMKEGRKGPLVAEFVAVRGVTVRDGLPGPADGLSLRRHGLTGALNTSLSHASADPPLPTLVRLSGRRWPIETGFAEGTPDLGLGDDEVRSWRGGPHHLPRGILAHFFLVRLQRRLQKTPRA